MEREREEQLNQPRSDEHGEIEMDEDAINEVDDLDDEEDMEMMMEECIANCLECHQTCLETIQYCLTQGGAHAEASHIRLLMDCAAICETSAGFMIRGSELHMRTCSVCAEVSARCADSCEAFSDDETMERCAEICRSCSESCAEMAEIGELEETV